MAGKLVKEVLMRITADDGDAEEKIARLAAKGEELKRLHPDLTPRIDTAVASAKIGVIRQELRDLSRQADAEAAKGGLLARLLGGAQGFADKAQKGGGPAWLGPALLAVGPAASLLGVAAGAGIGLGGAAVAGAGAIAAFGAVAKPVFADALKAEQAVQAAQASYNSAIAAGAKQATAYRTEQTAINKAYAQLSPQQIALSQQLGGMAQAWQDLKAAQTPVVAGALQPWLKSVTDLTANLGPIIGAVSPFIQYLGTQFDNLIRSDSFARFRDFIANTGSAVVGATGNTLIDVLRGLMNLLPQFAPLIDRTAGEVLKFGQAFLRWSESKKAADDIQKFMNWFSINGPAVGGLLKNIGGALKALAPGLGPAATSEINVMSQFFGFIARLPPGLARPLTEVAGVLLTLNKLGVVKAGVKFLGFLSGAGGAAAEEGAAAGGAAGLWAKMLPGVRLAGGVLVATLVVETILKGTSSGTGKNWWDNPFGQGTYKDPKTGKTQGTATALTSWITFGHDIEHYWDMTWQNTIGRTRRGWDDLMHIFDRGRHAGAVAFDGLRHDIAHIWDMTWNNTVGRLNRGINDMIQGIGTLPGRIGRIFSSAGSWLFQAGRNVIQGLLNGITSMIGSVGSTMGGILGEIRNFLPFSPAKKGPLSGSGSPDAAGRRIGLMLASGMDESRVAVAAAAARTARAASGTSAGYPAAAGAAGGNGRIVIELRGDAALRQWLKKSIRITGGSVQVVGA